MKLLTPTGLKLSRMSHHHHWIWGFSNGSSQRTNGRWVAIILGCLCLFGLFSRVSQEFTCRPGGAKYKALAASSHPTNVCIIRRQISIRHQFHVWLTTLGLFQMASFIDPWTVGNNSGLGAQTRSARVASKFKIGERTGSCWRGWVCTHTQSS